MKQHDYNAALPLLESAVQQLRGRSDLGTAYAEYNLGATLIALGRCSEAIPYLEASRAIQPSRGEVKDAIAAGARLFRLTLRSRAGRRTAARSTHGIHRT